MFRLRNCFTGFLLLFSCASLNARAQDLYVADYFPPSSIHRFSQGGVELKQFTLNSGRLEGLAFDKSGILYVSDYAAGKIRRFTQDGQELSAFASGLLAANGLRFDAAGNLYTTNLYSQIVRFTPTGQSLGIFVQTLQNEAPQDIVFDSHGNLYVSTYPENTIHKYSAAGADLGEFATGLNVPIGLAIDANDNLYVADRDSNSVRKFSSDGTNLGSIAMQGLRTPLDVALDANNNLYVSNYYGTVRKFSSTGQDMGVFADTGGSVAFMAFAPAAVPEPGVAALLLGAGFSCSVVWLRRKRS